MVKTSAGPGADDTSQRAGPAKLSRVPGAELDTGSEAGEDVTDTHCGGESRRGRADIVNRPLLEAYGKL